MRSWDFTDNASEWEILEQTPRTQAAVMTVPAGQKVGDRQNRHVNADQWLYVISGSGEAIVEGNRFALSSGNLLLIEAGEAHEIHAFDGAPLRTVNFYGPPTNLE